MNETPLDRITVDHGRVRWTTLHPENRIWVSLVLGMLADGASVDDVLAEYPDLVPDDLRACLAYGA
jgi:uncharacterized protein (DUF433 family)